VLNDTSGPGYRSCVQFVPGREGREIIAVGIPGISFSPDFGSSWQHVSDSSYYTIRINESGNSAWLAGRAKVSKMKW
jgi:hypothetical protein